jgi:hypothetical protein
MFWHLHIVSNLSYYNFQAMVDRMLDGDHWQHMQKVSIQELFSAKIIKASKNVWHK